MYELKQNPNLQDIIKGAKNLRDRDIEEIEASGFCANHVDALILSYQISENNYMDFVDGEPGLFAGIGDDGCVWCMTTKDYIENHTKRFLDITTEYIDKFQDDHEVLWNHVYVNNDVHIKWLKRCGFKFFEPEPYGTKGNLFMKFERRKD